MEVVQQWSDVRELDLQLLSGATEMVRWHTGEELPGASCSNPILFDPFWTRTNFRIL